MTNTLPVAGWRDDCGSRQPSLRNGRAAQCAQERLAKTGAQLAAIMADWHHAQRRALDQPDFSFRPPIAAAGPAAAMHPPIEARIADAAEALRRLHETGEIEWTDLSPLATYQMAFLDDEPVE